MKMQDMHSTVANHLVLTNFMSFWAFYDAGGSIRQFTEALGRNRVNLFYRNYLLNISKREKVTKKKKKKRGGEERAELISLFINW